MVRKATVIQGSTAMHCPKCGDELYDIYHSSEPEGLRKDRICYECGIVYMCTKANLSPIMELKTYLEDPAGVIRRACSDILSVISRKK